MSKSQPLAIFRWLTISFACLCLIAVALTLMSERSEAGMTRCGNQFTYYSDATYTTVVGTQTWAPTACGCTLTQSGTISWYRTIEPVGCY